MFSQQYGFLGKLWLALGVMCGSLTAFESSLQIAAIILQISPELCMHVPSSAYDHVSMHLCLFFFLTSSVPVLYI